MKILMWIMIAGALTAGSSGAWSQAAKSRAEVKADTEQAFKKGDVARSGEVDPENQKLGNATAPTPRASKARAQRKTGQASAAAASGAR